MNYQISTHSVHMVAQLSIVLSEFLRKKKETKESDIMEWGQQRRLCSYYRNDLYE